MAVVNNAPTCVVKLAIVTGLIAIPVVTIVVAVLTLGINNSSLLVGVTGTDCETLVPSR